VIGFLRKFLRWNHIPAVLVMGLLFFFSSRAGGHNPWLQPPMDKVIHWLAYFVLGFSFCVWIRYRRWMESPLRYGLIVFFVVALFGMSDEFHQSFVPNRQVSLADWIADVAGGASAVLVYLGIKGYRLTR
jgi:VanZ family protein